MERIYYRCVIWCISTITNPSLYLYSWLRSAIPDYLCENTTTTTLCWARTCLYFTRNYWNFIEGLICGNTYLP